MNTKQKKIVAAAAVVGAAWWLLTRPNPASLRGYPYMGHAGGAGPGQTGTGGRSPGQ